jgi:hypothetical protein
MAVSTLAADNDRVSFYGGGFERRIGIYYFYMGHVTIFIILNSRFPQSINFYIISAK